MKAIVNINLDNKTEIPDENIANYNYYTKGDEVEIVDIVNGESVAGNKVWYKLDNGKYIWSGGVEGMNDLSLDNDYKIFNANDNYWLKDYNIPELWASGLTGKGVKVAVLDSGLSLPHRNLIDNQIIWKDLSSSDKPGVHDITGHGTHCAGIIKASDNGYGIKGLAYECKLYFGKIKNDELGDSLKRLKFGLNWAISEGVDLISVSMGRITDAENLGIVLKEAVSKNIIPVCAGGNKILNVTNDNDILYPAKYQDCISVGAVDKDKKPSVDTLTSSSLTIGAPGTGIKSTFLNNSYKELTGTSQAAPYVCGVLALIIQYCKEQNIAYSINSMKDWLKLTSDKSVNAPFPVINPEKLLNHLKTI